ncbi:TetR/AcrR family transcriptional regulator [Blastococcus sp. TML/C7B]|uniref:TetR/AcrR family transcriptional regulator n=1 Tax=Blastococcus sp. TML/C7B TaxID=2798728 RepID=UPI00190B4974|nr:TetR/AcrR family transcriptional regulator [Blastococcus sp. TML/C7B]MBN1096815.1 TetR/AcrR family transcriptional regulator [Blastococcus sp. TML/C7B]
MTGTTSRGRPRGLSERVRLEVHAAVRRLLVAEGYAALRLDDVAAAAGVHKSTLYRQWATKGQLVRDVLVAGELEHYPRVDEGSLAADVDALVRGLVRLFRSPTHRGVRADPRHRRRPGAAGGAARAGPAGHRLHAPAVRPGDRPR